MREFELPWLHPRTGGFQALLFGYEPDLDYNAIVKGRVAPHQPHRSCQEFDPAQAHVQRAARRRVRFNVGSLEYEAILDWIRDGATYDSAGSPRLKTLSRPKRSLIGIGAKHQLRVTGTYGRLHRRPPPQGAVHTQ
jgi:hypothetical protein